MSVIKGLFGGIVSSLKKKPIDYDEAARMLLVVLYNFLYPWGDRGMDARHNKVREWARSHGMRVPSTYDLIDIEMGLLLFALKQWSDNGRYGRLIKSIVPRALEFVLQSDGCRPSLPNVKIAYNSCLLCLPGRSYGFSFVASVKWYVEYFSKNRAPKEKPLLSTEYLKSDVYKHLEFVIEEGAKTCENQLRSWYL